MNSNDETLYEAMDEGNTNLPPLPVEADQEAIQPETPERSGGSKAGVIVGAIAGGLALGGLSTWGVYELFNQYNSLADMDGAFDELSDAVLAQATPEEPAAPASTVTHVTHVDHVYTRQTPRAPLDADRDGFDINDTAGGRNIDDDGGMRTTQNRSDSGGIDTTIDINGRNTGGNVVDNGGTNPNPTGVAGDQPVQLAETELNGEQVIVGMLYDADGNRVLLIDQDRDGIFDIRATDVNGDSSFSEVTQLEQGMNAVHVGEFQRELENNGIQPMYSYNDNNGTNGNETETGGSNEIELAGIEVLQSEDGSEMTVATMRMGRQEVMLVDADNDGVYEYTVRDLNHDGTIDNNEIQRLEQPIGSGQVYSLPTSDDFQDPDGIYAQNAVPTGGTEPEPIDIIEVDGPEEWAGVGMVYASDSNEEGVMVDTTGDGYYDTLIPYTYDQSGNIMLDHDHPRDLDTPVAYNEPDPMYPDDGQQEMNIYPEDPNLIAVADQPEIMEGLAYDEQGNPVGTLTSEGVIYDDPAMNVGNPAAIALGVEPEIDPETGMLVGDNMVSVDYNDDADLYPADPEDDNLVQVDESISDAGGYEAGAIEVDYQPEPDLAPEPVTADYAPEPAVDYAPEPEAHYDDAGGYDAPDPGDTFEV